jgi:hypothetical protein
MLLRLLIHLEKRIKPEDIDDVVELNFGKIRARRQEIDDGARRQAATDDRVC